jgi:hypothetical protein
MTSKNIKKLVQNLKSTRNPKNFPSLYLFFRYFQGIKTPHYNLSLHMKPFNIKKIILIIEIITNNDFLSLH